jgi:20S proteasome subunit alpha 4
LSEPSGALSAWKAAAIGKNSDKVNELLEASYTDFIDYNKGLTLVVDCMLQYVEAGAKNMEIAVMYSGKEMQIVSDDEIQRIIDDIEDKKKKEESKK